MSEEARAVNLERPEVPEALAVVVKKMMAKEAAQRYQTPIEVAQALMPFIQAAGKGASAASSSQPPAAGPPAVKQESKPRAGAAKEVVAGHQKSVAEGRSAMGEGRHRLATKSHSPAAKKAAQRKWFLVAGGVTVVLLLVLVKTEDGTIVLENLPADAEVLVDGKKVTVTWGEDRKQAQIRVKPGTRKIEAVKDGIEVIGEEVVIADGRLKVLTARLDKPAVKENPKPGEPSPVEAAKRGAERAEEEGRPRKAGEEKLPPLAAIKTELQRRLAERPEEKPRLRVKSPINAISGRLTEADGSPPHFTVTLQLNEVVTVEETSEERLKIKNENGSGWLLWAQFNTFLELMGSTQ
jgi:hypothetical protein